jgi:hypothetical protein
VIENHNTIAMQYSCAGNTPPNPTTYLSPPLLLCVYKIRYKIIVKHKENQITKQNKLK